MSKKVSVIVPVYNVEEFLPKCLDTLVNQTLEEIEIIVVNDGSPDHSQEIIDRYAIQYPDKIRAFQKPNGGLSDARNFGIPHATGEYLAFVDSDDTVDLDMFEKMYEKALSGDYDIVTCPITYVKGRVVERRYYQNTDCFGTNILESPMILRYTNSYAWNKIYRRSFWNQHGFQFPVNQWFEDSAVIYNILLSANKIGSVNIPFYNYVQKREGAITSTADRRIFDIFKSVDSILAYYRNYPGFAEHEELKKEIEFICIRHIMARIILLAHSDDKQLIRDFSNQVFAYLDANLPGWRSCSYVTPEKESSRKTKTVKFIRRHKVVLNAYYCSPRWIRRFFAKSYKWIRKKKKKAKNIRFFSSREQKAVASRLHKQAALQANGPVLLTQMQKILAGIGFCCFADFSTLAGLKKDGHLPESDISLDMGVVIQEEKNISQINQALERHGVSIWRLYYHKDQIVQGSYHFFGLHIDLHFYRPDGSNTKLLYFYRNPDMSYPYREGDIVEMTYPQIGGMDTCLVDNLAINLPSNASELLQIEYGEMWQENETQIFAARPAFQLLEGEGYFVQYRYYGIQKTNEKVYQKINHDQLSILRKLQLQELFLLKELDRICKEHGIRYFLSEGTLLGAVRHQGFIPWDDDLDVIMPRADYNRFLSIWKQGNHTDEIALLNESVFPQYYLTFSKLVCMRPTGFYNDRDNFPEEYRGPYIDIFPLDHGIEVEDPKRVRDIRKYRDILLLKANYMKPRGKRKKLYALMSRFYSFSALQNKIQKMYQYYNGNPKATYWVNFASSYPPQKETFPSEIYNSDPQYIEFEGLPVPIPQDADFVLRQIYGNYMKLPPQNKRASRHLLKYDENFLEGEEKLEETE